MKRNRKNGQAKDGIALVIVLGILSILLILGVAFATALRTDQLVSRNNLDSLRARQFIDTAFSRAMDYVDVDTDPDLDGINFFMTPPQTVTYSGRTAGTGESIPMTNLLFGTASNYLPPDVISGVLLDPATPDPQWEAISVSGGVIAVPALTGRVAFIAVDGSGYIDGNVSGGLLRNHGGDVGEIALMDVKQSELSEFINSRQTKWGKFDTRPDIEALAAAEEGANPLIGGENWLMQPFSRFPSNYWDSAANKEKDHFDFNKAVSGVDFNYGGGSASPPAQNALQSIEAAITQSGIHPSIAGDLTKVKQLAANIRDYIDTDIVPGNGEFSEPMQGSGKPLTNLQRHMAAICTEAVPMLNEVMIKHTLELHQDLETLNIAVRSTIEVEIETWFPFDSSAAHVSSDFKVELVGLAFLGATPAGNGGPSMIIPRTTLTRSPGSMAGYDIHLLASPVSDPPVVIPGGIPYPIFADAYGVVEIAVIEKNTGEVVDHLAFEILEWATELGLPGDDIPMGTHIGTLTREANDPRINWRWEPDPDPAKNHWADASGTMGFANQRMTAYFTANDESIVDGGTLMHVRNGPIQSVGELGQLLYDEERPWKTIRLLSPDLENTARLVEHFAKPAVEEGYINLNSKVIDALASAFLDWPIRSFPGGSSSGVLSTNEAQAIALVILNNGVSSNMEFKTRADLATRVNPATNADERGLISAKHLMEVLPGIIPDSATAENLISDAYGLFGTRQNLYTVLAVAEVFAPKSETPVAEMRAVGLVWRDPIPVEVRSGVFHHETFLRNLVWLD